MFYSNLFMFYNGDVKLNAMSYLEIFHDGCDRGLPKLRIFEVIHSLEELLFYIENMFYHSCILVNHDMMQCMC